MSSYALTSSQPVSPLWQKSTLPKGQSALRAANERRILSLIRHHKELPKSVIAKETGLSAQAATVIINKLEEDGLVKRGAPQRGKRGQPTVPFSLNPQGAFGIGIKIGRRNIHITLIDFTGNVVNARSKPWNYPSVTTMRSFLAQAISELIAPLSDDQQQRMSGIGVAIPFELWRWSEQTGAPEAELLAWKDIDMLAEVERFSDLPVYLCNDDTAACAAELWFGKHNDLTDYLYCFIGTFIGGGLVLNRHLHTGRTGNAGAIGSLPTFSGASNKQLIEQSSLYLLEQALKHRAIDTHFLHQQPLQWPDNLPVLNGWLEQVADGLMHTAISAQALLDLDAIVIDGAIPENIKARIVSRCQAKLTGADMRGLSPLQIKPGSIGAGAQSLGCANLPLLALYSI
ncbi:ROK family transcriptional regulator [Alteromonas gilva]|uniref:ROK family transcriptional regulator n=1 Tax=Alteromonas gilva TaxID=2987522 RepID=A0ABT5L1I4_9ALTE|nr:ROK family transcriptional regulator [Alteromonas gilva]MDC8830274.1 ROK family transcriptional regulator [Alteromonas gilva]